MRAALLVAVLALPVHAAMPRSFADAPSEEARGSGVRFGLGFGIGPGVAIGEYFPGALGITPDFELRWTFADAFTLQLGLGGNVGSASRSGSGISARVHSTFGVEWNALARPSGESGLDLGPSFALGGVALHPYSSTSYWEGGVLLVPGFFVRWAVSERFAIGARVRVLMPIWIGSSSYTEPGFDPTFIDFGLSMIRTF